MKQYVIITHRDGIWPDGAYGPFDWDDASDCLFHLVAKGTYDSVTVLEMVPDPNDCDDCAVNTLVNGETYMVADALWPPSAGILCVGCLEGRLGRLLQADDFKDVPLNRMGLKSTRLVERIGSIG